MQRLRLIAPLIFIAAAQCIVTAAQTDERDYPATISVVSSETDAGGRRHIQLRLKLDDNVAVYANPVRAQGMDHASARVAVFDAENQPVKAKITYPEGTKLETDFGDYYLYRKFADIRVVLPATTPLPVTFRCHVAGINERIPFCLGFGRLETTLENSETQKQSRPTKPVDDPISGGEPSAPAR